MPRVFRRALSGAVAVSSVLAALLFVAGPAAAVAPRTPAGLPGSIEPLAPYVEQVSCDPTVRPGTAKLARLLASTYRSYGATAWNSTYSCGTDGTRSEHYDGRAIDWMVSIRNSRQHAAAKAALAWLLATDAAGNRFAMARRLGVMYLIYDNRMWGSWDGRWHDYNGCSRLKSHSYDNACHRTHIHISLSWNGAMGRTSFWTKHVAPTDFGPCRARDLNWAYRYVRTNLRGCPSYPLVKAARKASATKKALVQYSGAPVRRGWGGPAVTAVQQGLHLPGTGQYGSSTVAAVRRFQRAHHLNVTGAMNPRTWRALLASVR
jgi:peptidoglycan hydrolase-like protein with peptidoglycan-binding domain